MKKEIFGSIIEGGIQGFVVSLMKKAGEKAEESAESYLKSAFGGFGNTDEYLFARACAYGLRANMFNERDLKKIFKVLDSFSKSKRNRIITIIGKEESTVTHTFAKLDGEGNPVTNKKTGKQETYSKTLKENVNGAEILSMLAKMTPKEIKDFFETSGFADSFSGRVGDSIANLKKGGTSFAENVKSSEFKRNAENFFKEETFLEKLANGKVNFKNF